MGDSQAEMTGRVFRSASQQNVAVILTILFFLNKLYDCIFIIIEVAIYIYKGVRLPYDPSDIGLEAALLAILIILDTLRFFFGAKGNLTQRLASLSLSLLLTPAVLLIGLHVMLWQTYVTLADYILGAILISFHTAEFVFLLLAMLISTGHRNISGR